MEHSTPRRCRICDSGSLEPLHEQHFIIPDQEHPFRYVVNHCTGCGFIFAGDIPTQDQYDAYYKINTIYAYNLYEDAVPEGLKTIHGNSFREIHSFLQTRTPGTDRQACRILDIGASTGYLLHLFREAGYQRLLGIEPSGSCSVAGKIKYGVDIVPCSLSEFRTVERFDLVLLSGVLEHIEDYRGFLVNISKLLAEDGVLFVLVPDAGRFSLQPREPFNEFSLEHINYFTETSLGNLLGKTGFAPIKISSVHADFYDSECLMVFAAKSTESFPIVQDVRGVERIKAYISKSEEATRSIGGLIDGLVRSREEIAVWGCGALTSRLLASTGLPKVNLKAFIDSNKSLHGKKLAGIEIVPPDFLRDKRTTVFVSTCVYGNEIKNFLLKEYSYQGKIITL